MDPLKVDDLVQLHCLDENSPVGTIISIYNGRAKVAWEKSTYNYLGKVFTLLPSYSLENLRKVWYSIAQAD